MPFRTTVPTACLALLLTSVASPAAAAEDDRAALREHLQRTRQMFLSAVAGLSEEQWTFKPDPERWSIAECAEHLAASESFIRDAVAATLQGPAAEDTSGTGKDDTVLTLIVDRSQRFQAPEPVRPTGRFGGMEDVILEFSRQRARTFELLRQAEGLRTHVSEHPAFGPLDAQGWLYFLSGHTERHTLQIEEVKSADGYPTAESAGAAP